ncbi:MAG: sugar phosphate isomerase/epimerase, partial [Clostridia bacterium]|nr:sugar phosphate isomerase/epimerase [Clostridia bacterium]
MKKFPIAIQVYSVRDVASKDLRGTLQQLKNMGYDGVEFAGLYDHKPEEIKQMVEEIGLIPISAHVPLDTLLADIPGVVADYKKIGCQYIAIPWISEERRPGGARYEETVAD